MAANDIKVIPKVPLHEQLSSSNSSLLKRYQDKVLGESNNFELIYYEIVVLLLTNVAGSIGYVLRKRFFASLFKKFGKGIILGRGLTLRHPNRISMGDHVAIDENVLLDASGSGDDGIVINSNVIISRNCVIQGKSGPVRIGSQADIGCNTILTSGNGIHIGDSVLIAGNCYLGGGRYITERIDIPMMEQGLYSKGPVTIEDDVWLGAGVTVLDGVTIGRGSIVGARALVTKDLPPYSVAVGVPAKVIKSRKEEAPL